jgi:hypothetical protein
VVIVSFFLLIFNTRKGIPNNKTFSRCMWVKIEENERKKEEEKKRRRRKYSIK